MTTSSARRAAHERAERQQIEREARWNAWYAERDPKDLAQARASVQPHMEKPAIRALLGEPHHIQTTRNASCWTYERDGARGRIEFGYEGRVTTVHPPSSTLSLTTP